MAFKLSSFKSFGLLLFVCCCDKNRDEILKTQEDLNSEIGIAMDKVPYWDIVKAVSKFNLRVREVEKRDGNNIKNRFK